MSDQSSPAGPHAPQVLAQTPALVSVDDLTPHPDNPRRGDLNTILASIQRNGFYGVLVVEKHTGYILVGNHRYQAAVMAGLTELPVLYVDVDRDTAKRILLADNRLNDLATYDAPQLVSVLRQLLRVSVNAQVGDETFQDIDRDDLELALAGSGYSLDDTEQLLNGVIPPTLDQLSQALGPADERVFWPVVKLSIPADVLEIYESLLSLLPGQDESYHYQLLLQAVDEATLRTHVRA